MNKLEQKLHLELLKTISSEDKTRFCASLTKDVAVKFAEWKFDLKGNEFFATRPSTHENPSDSDLFDYFITNIYKP